MDSIVEAAAEEGVSPRVSKLDRLRPENQSQLRAGSGHPPAQDECPLMSIEKDTTPNKGITGYGIDLGVYALFLTACSARSIT